MPRITIYICFCPSYTEVMDNKKHINLAHIPPKPGVYQFKDSQGSILYIGKANNLKSRVSSYFQKSAALTPHKQLMIERIKKVEYIITSSATEALLLESNLIKKHQPPYNIDLKDDKYFLYIKISVNEDFPRVFTVRRLAKDGARYFGPFVSAGAVRETLRTLRLLFPHRNFQKPVTDHQLSYLTDRYPQLLGPSDQKEYRQTIERIITFLKGHYGDIARDLQKKMVAASHKRQFEKAATLRDKIQAIERIAERQKVISTKHENEDIISLARAEDVAAINLFNVRNGMLMNKQSFILRNITDQSDAEIVAAFIEQYYPQATDLPKEVIVPERLPNRGVMEQALKIKIFVPQKGVKRQYLTLGQENAAAYLAQQKTSWEKDTARITNALQQLKQYIRLKKIPERIEVFDISNIQGVHPVGSMIVFTKGKPDKKWYRKFKIKTVTGANDPAMMAEVVSRRFAHTKRRTTHWPEPDLIILDGGKGQLSAVQKKINLTVPIITLAKKEEDVYLPGQKKPVNFPRNSEALFLIERMRDEAHRFAVTFFRKTHQQSLRHSSFDDIPGFGPKTRKLLIKRFGSLKHAQDAVETELSALVGKTLARRIKENI